MACSPVVIGSSSPPPFRFPSETPPQPLRPAESSSPGLPSPSTFFSRPATGLQHSENVSKAESATGTSFKSAATLVKSNYFQDKAGKGSDGSGTTKKRVKELREEIMDEGEHQTIPGRHRLKTRAAVSVATSKPAIQSPVQTYGHHSPSTDQLPRTSQNAVGNISTINASRQAKQGSRTPSISLSVYSFDGGFEQNSPACPAGRGDTSVQAVARVTKLSNSPAGSLHRMSGLPSAQHDSFMATTPEAAVQRTSAVVEDMLDAAPSKATKKHGTKTKSVSEASKKEAPKKQTRRPVAKSASFVLNSDDLASTQFAGLDAAQVQGVKLTESGDVQHDEASIMKKKRAPRKPKQKADGDNGPGQVRPKMAKAKKDDEHSAYFVQPPVKDATIPLSKDGEAYEVLEECINGSVQAHRRRRSWTPIKDTTLAPGRSPGTPRCGDSTDADKPQLSLATVLGGLAYAGNGPAPTPGAPSGEAPLKRRRIDLAEEASLGPQARKQRKDAQSELHEPSKKKRAPKKKAQTITELATKAYRLETVVQDVQPTVSSFFAATEGDAIDGVLDVTSKTNEANEQTKATRKPRSKKKATEEQSGEKMKRAAKSKAKVRFHEDDLYSQLYAPEEARLQEERQQFLFGTSSQLGTTDSPSFIRQMQLAVRESERAVDAHHYESPSRKSCTKVPSAPHGTSLSCGQASKELWCSAARNLEDDLLSADEHLPRTDAVLPSHVSRSKLFGLDRPCDIVEHIPAICDGLQQSNTTGIKPNVGSTHDIVEQETIDLCVSSSANLANEFASPEKKVQEPAPISLKDTQSTSVRAPGLCAMPISDDWEILCSSPDVPLSEQKLFRATVPRMLPQLKRSATSSIRDRTALRTLDVNTSPRRALLHTQCTTLDHSEKQKKSRGRPRKDLTDTIPVPLEREVHITGLTQNAAAETEKRRSPKKLFSSSQPVASQKFVNIDEISDSDDAGTASPSRRRASSSPPATRALDLEIIPSPSPKAKPKAGKTEAKDTAPEAAAWSKLKPDDVSWASIAPKLFRQITATVKSTKPSTDPAHPTWYEKILLYDPIVLEDLTAWLDERGVRVECKRLKVKPKAKGRKKKAEQIEDETVEYEMTQEPLKPWMVQKWCEDKSICCLWKEGLRGGVKTRY